MAKVIAFEQINPHCAGIDIGSEKIFVSTDGHNVQSYPTFTHDYKRCIADLQKQGILRVAMEATGVYWVAFHTLLEEAGIEVCLVNPKEVKQVKGRKTDVKDCQWIQKLFAAGLIRQSFIPKGELKNLRLLVRERLDLIEDGSKYVLKMQKYLELMNIKLTQVISQITGASGLSILEAIIGGQRDAKVLLQLCSRRITDTKAEVMLKALEGNYDPACIFLLEQNLQMWRMFQDRIYALDQNIEALLKKMAEGGQEPSPTPAKRVRHHAPQIKDLHTLMQQIYGADITTLSGINDYTALRLLGEIGTDMSRFASRKHFVSWAGLSPGHNQSGKRSRGGGHGHGHRVGRILRECAQSLSTSKHIAIGDYIRRIRHRKGPRVAMKAGARKLAESLYNILTRGKHYVEQGVEHYQQQLASRELKTLQRLSLKHKYELKPICVT